MATLRRLLVWLTGEPAARSCPVDRGWPGGRALLSLLLLPLGCGDGLIDSSFHGQPLLSLRGNVKGAADTLPLEQPLLRVSVFWSPRGARFSGFNDLVEQPAISTQSFVPFSFTLTVFDIPEAQHYSLQPDGSRFAIGTPLGYYDKNGNGRRDSSEPFLASGKNVLLYAPQLIPGGLSPLGQPVAAGYYQPYAALPCPPLPGSPPRPPDPQVTGNDCSAGVSQACSSNSDCGLGVCIRELLMPWPKGGCVLPDPLPAGCGSQGLSRITWSPPAERGQLAPPPVTYWVKRCAQDSDCGRSFPYQCDIAYGACLPTLLMTLDLSDSPPAPQFCR